MVKENKMSSLAYRIKRYEQVTHHVASIRTPLIIRVDGRAFHSYTRGMKRPFDEKIMRAMVTSALQVAEEMMGFVAAYIQSDEVSFLLTDYQTIQTDSWFGYDLSKVNSITASLMTAHFNVAMNIPKLAVFDSRAFNVPVDDVVNTFLWRAQDWERNSLQMYARSIFSHKQLHGKNRSDMHEMLHDVGKNWTTDLSPIERNGTFLIREESGIGEYHDINPTYTDIETSIGHLI